MCSKGRREQRTKGNVVRSFRFGKFCHGVVCIGGSVLPEEEVMDAHLARGGTL